MNTNYYVMRKNQGGFLLVAALGFIVAFSFLVFIVSQKLTLASDAQILSMLSNQANNAANSGVEEGVYIIVNSEQSRQYCEAMSLKRQMDEKGLRNCQITVSCSMATVEQGIEREKPAIFLIKSQAQCGGSSTYATRTIESSVLKQPEKNGQYQIINLYRKVK